MMTTDIAAGTGAATVVDSAADITVDRFIGLGVDLSAGCVGVDAVSDILVNTADGLLSDFGVDIGGFMLAERSADTVIFDRPVDMVVDILVDMPVDPGGLRIHVRRKVRCLGRRLCCLRGFR